MLLNNNPHNGAPLALRPLGSQGSASSYAQALELVALVDDVARPLPVQPFGKRIPPARLDAWSPLPPPDQRCASPLPVAVAYRCASLFARGEVDRALDEARAARGRGAALVAPELVAVARDALASMLADDLRPLAPLALEGSPMRQVQVARLAAREAVVRPLLALSEPAVRDELWRVGVVDGLRSTDLAGVLALFGSSNLRPWMPLLDVMTLSEGVSGDYCRALLEHDAGLPMSVRGYQRAPEGVRAALLRDPSFDLEGLPEVVEPLRRTPAVVAVEARVDVEVRATRGARA